jgi:hypothetical protein
MFDAARMDAIISSTSSRSRGLCRRSAPDGGTDEFIR